MDERTWKQDLRDHLAESTFLEDNRSGANIGEKAGAVVGPAVVVAGVVYVGTSAAVTGVQAAVAARVAERTLRVGEAAGTTAAAVLLKNTLEAAKVLGEAGGAYAGAGVQATGRRIVGIFRGDTVEGDSERPPRDPRPASSTPQMPESTSTTAST